MKKKEVKQKMARLKTRGAQFEVVGSVSPDRGVYRIPKAPLAGDSTRIFANLPRVDAGWLS